MIKKKMVLFVRGFNTYMESNSDDHYANFTNFFMLSEFSLIYFNYSPDEDISTVYKRLSNILDTHTYDILLAHSLGCGLLMKYITDHKDKVSGYEKIVYLMPLIVKTRLNDIISMIPLIEYVKLPKHLILPNNKLYHDGNVLNDNLRLIPIQQVVNFYRDYMNHIDITLINSSNSTLVYASEEEFNVIDTQHLDAIKNKVFVSGKHECFNELGHSTAFFNALKQILITDQGSPNQ